MLRFRLRQLHLPSLGRYYIPLPKLSDAQLGSICTHLRERGFSVRLGSGPGKMVALRGAQRISIDGVLGLAASGHDMLDALAPAIPSLLASPGERAGGASADVAALYFSLKGSGVSTELQLFPRLESLRTWTFLRREGLCGLTPDEAVVLRHLLAKASDTSKLECVTAKPREGSRALQAGMRLYYKSSVPVAEFLSSLRTIDSDGADSACYLPRDSVIRLPRARIDNRIKGDELGEWCYIT